MGQAAKTRRSALPPRPPSRHLLSDRIPWKDVTNPQGYMTRRRGDARQLTGKFAELPLGEPPAICAGVLPPVPRGQGDGRQGRASTRVDSRARALRRGSRRPRSPQQRTLEMRPNRRLRLPFPAKSSVLSRRPSRQRGELARRKDVGEGQA
jgi:hypothetical protein